MGRLLIANVGRHTCVRRRGQGDRGSILDPCPTPTPKDCVSCEFCRTKWRKAHEGRCGLEAAPPPVVDKSCPLGGKPSHHPLELKGRGREWRRESGREACSSAPLALVLALKCASPSLRHIRGFSAGKQVREEEVARATGAREALRPSGDLQMHKGA